MRRCHIPDPIQSWMLTSNRRSADLENEVAELRKQLAEARNMSASTSGPVPLTSFGHWAMPSADEPTLTSSSYGNIAPIDGSGNPRVPEEAASLSLNESPVQNSDLGANTHTPGLTTRPDADELQPRPPILSSTLGPRSLGSTSLSVDSIADLYQK